MRARRTYAVAGPLTRAVDELESAYVDWREQEQWVEDSYTVWVRAEREQQPASFAAYRAALDREEEAANTYSAVVAKLSRLLP